MSTLYVLMLLWTSTNPAAAPMSQNAVFTTEKACEDALGYWRTVNAPGVRLAGSRCFKQ